jgi:hypothetical protein
LNNSHGFGLQWLLQLCIFSQANKLCKLAKGVGQEWTETMGTKDWRVLQANNGLLYKRMGKTRQEIISKIHLSKIFLSDIFSCKLGSKELENFQLVTGEFCSLGRLKTTLGF